MSEDLSLNKDNDSQSYSLYEDLRDEAQSMIIEHDKKYRPSKAIRDHEFGMPQSSSIATVNKRHSRKRATSKVNPYGRVSVFGEDILPRPSIETKQRKSILLNPRRNPPTIMASSFTATENPPSQLDKRKVPEVLREIPVTVLRCGKLVDVKDGVARIFQETAPVIKTIVTSDYLSAVPNKVSLKIRSEDGSEIYFVHMSPDDTVGMLYNLLNQMRSSNGEEGSRDYVILSRCLSIVSLPLLDEQMTLRQYNIIHNSVLHLQASTRNS
ncbi:uncharacterized protein [Periplaneta americana]|uniref:uncharacterized protein n=1 Tax=Periplaneta americana TaxID=6978 RepID=UPI0037E78D3D